MIHCNRRSARRDKHYVKCTESLQAEGSDEAWEALLEKYAALSDQVTQLEPVVADLLLVDPTQLTNSIRTECQVAPASLPTVF